MKLIRITSDDPLALFETKFNEDIVIPPESQIALANASFDTVFKDVVIDANNDEVKFELAVGGAGQKTISLDHGTYSSSTADTNSMMSQLQNGFNTKLGFTSNEIGKSFRVSNSNVDHPTAGKVKIDMRTASPKVVEADFEFLGSASVNKTDTQTKRAYFQEEGNAFSDDSNKMLGVDHWPLGCCFARAKIRALVDNSSADNGFRMWLSDKPVHELKDQDDIALTDTKIYLQVAPVDGGGNSGTFRYKTSVNGATLVDSTKNVVSHAIKAGGDPDGNGADDVAGTDNDVVEIRQVGGVISVVVYRDGEASAETLATLNYDYSDTNNKRLFWGMSFQGDRTNTSIESLQVHFDPFAPPLPPVQYTLAEIPEEPEFGATPTRKLQKSSVNTLEVIIDSQELRDYLGFENRVNTSESSRASCSIFADYLFTANIFNDSFVFELLNIDLESYDSFSGGKRNILKVIPASAVDADSVVDYEANNLTFIDIRNKFPLTLRNIKARVLRNDLEPIVVRGLSVCTLLIRNKGETL